MTKLPNEDTIRAWIHLHRAHRALLDKVELSLKKNGLPPLDWYDVLLELSRARGAGLRQYEIGERVLLSKHNLSRLIDRLERNDLVRRYACTEDGRGNRIKITAGGERLLKQVWPVYREALQVNFGDKLSSVEMMEMTRLLSKALG